MIHKTVSNDTYVECTVTRYTRERTRPKCRSNIG